MSDLDSLLVSVSGRIVHDWDFAFHKNNGEIANRLRSELSSSIREIAIDSDGDIEIQTGVGSIYATPSAVIIGGWLTDSQSLSRPEGTAEFGRIIDLVAKSKGSFAVQTYSVRLFFRFTPVNGLKLLGDLGFESILRSILGDKTPSDIRSYKFSTRHDKDEFLSVIELEASTKDVQLRYSRDRNGTEFDSFRAFLNAADLTGLIQELKPFAGVLVAAQQPRIGRAPFGGSKR
jgi:hypothetical protein